MRNTKDPNKIYGQTISFRYFADTRLKSKTRYRGEQRLDSYPLYIQIKVKKQTSQRKSIINAYVAPKELDGFLRDRATDVTTETNTLRDAILIHNPFENDNFNLSKSLEGLNVLREDVCSIIGMLIYSDFEQARTDDSIQLMQSDLLYSIPELHFGLYANDVSEQLEQLELQALQTHYSKSYDSRKEDIPYLSLFRQVRDLAVPGKPHVLKLYNKYNKHFWGLDRYCHVIRSQTRLTVVTFEIFLSEDFRKTFKDYFGTKVYSSVYEGFNQFFSL